MTETPTTPALAAAGSRPRRDVLCGLLLVGVLGPAAAGTLAACGDSGPSGTPPRTAGPTAESEGESAPAPTGPAGTALAKVSAVPVGGGLLVTAPSGSQVLLVQPVAGTVKAYNPHCTHQGTVVRTPQQGVMTCPNHGSQFKATDGSVVRGPAASPLREVAITVQGGDVTLA